MLLLVLFGISGWALAFYFWRNAERAIEQTDDALDLNRLQRRRLADLDKGGPHR